ncbi:MAG: hypothetical protein HMLKMBBP_00804 [Planctomycetes bacterium]|nr:hypothetical protein [Planctomycetota bacterium]
MKTAHRQEVRRAAVAERAPDVGRELGPVARQHAREEAVGAIVRTRLAEPREGGAADALPEPTHAVAEAHQMRNPLHGAASRRIDVERVRTGRRVPRFRRAGRCRRAPRTAASEHADPVAGEEVRRSRAAREGERHPRRAPVGEAELEPGVGRLLFRGVGARDRRPGRRAHDPLDHRDGQVVRLAVDPCRPRPRGPGREGKHGRQDARSPAIGLGPGPHAAPRRDRVQHPPGEGDEPRGRRHGHAREPAPVEGTRTRQRQRHQEPPGHRAGEEERRGEAERRERMSSRHRRETHEPPRTSPEEIGTPASRAHLDRTDAAEGESRARPEAGRG